MKTQLLFRQYIWLMETIDRAGMISLQKINERWIETEMSGGLKMPRATFVHHRAAIEEMFGIYIECDVRNGYKYYIGNPEDLHTASLQRWLVNSMSASAMIAESRDLKNYILIEDIPSGHHFLKPVLDAIRQKKQVLITYQKFLDSEPYSAVMEPYCVKLFHQRWYMVARRVDSSKPNPLIYALDRFKGAEIIYNSNYSIPSDFDAELFFANYFGVFADPDAKPVRVVLRAYSKQAQYLRTLPLHHSQKELATVTNGDVTFTDFEYYMAVTFDLLSEILKLNSWIEVIEPLSLRNDLTQQLKKTLSLYEK